MVQTTRIQKASHLYLYCPSIKHLPHHPVASFPLHSLPPQHQHQKQHSPEAPTSSRSAYAAQTHLDIARLTSLRYTYWSSEKDACCHLANNQATSPFGFRAKRNKQIQMKQTDTQTNKQNQKKKKKK